LMLFRVDFEGESIYCSSARCIQRLLSLGWRLADPSQARHLLAAVEPEEAERQEPVETLHPRRHC